MKRITTWIAATLAVVALAAGYQISQSGDGKPAAAQSSSSASSTQTRPDDGRTGGSPDEHAGKPGENK